MADHRTARPVSGEIMTSGRADSHGELLRGSFVDVVDAEFEVIGDDGPAVTPRTQQASGQGMDILRGAAVPAPSQPMPPRRGGPFFWLVGLSFAAASFWVSGGHAVVRELPFLAAQEPAPMLAIAAVTSRVDVSGPRPVLFVDGEAVNGGTADGSLPELEIRVIGNDGRTTLYNLGTSGRTMRPGDRFSFSSRLEVPKNGVKTVSVTFAE